MHQNPCLYRNGDKACEVEGNSRRMPRTVNKQRGATQDENMSPKGPVAQSSYEDPVV